MVRPNPYLSNPETSAPSENSMASKTSKAPCTKRKGDSRAGSEDRGPVVSIYSSFNLDLIAERHNHRPRKLKLLDEYLL